MLPLSFKQASGVADALSTLYTFHPFRYLQTDKGKEFLNSRVTAFCKRFNIKQFSSEDDRVKASLAERFNRTLRGKIHRHFTATMKGDYISSLQSVVDAYNNSIHSSIGVAPNDVTLENSEETFIRLY